MWITIFFILFQVPELEIPHITIYGERGRVEIRKETLLPDSVFPLPVIKEFTPKSTKLRARDKVKSKEYTTRFLFELGSSGKGKLYAGYHRTSLSVNYEKDVLGVDENLMLGFSIPQIKLYHQNISFRDGVTLDGRRYEKTGIRFNFQTEDLSLNCLYERSELSSDKYDRVNLDATCTKDYLEVSSRTSFYLDRDYITSLSVGLPFYIHNLTLVPGVFGALSNSRYLARVYPTFRIKGTFQSLSVLFTYLPSSYILDRDDILTKNPYTVNLPYNYNTGKSFELSVISPYIRISGGYRQNYPIFVYDTNRYTLADTESYFLGGRVEWSNLSLGVEYLSNASDHMPYLLLLPQLTLEWERIEFNFSSPFLLRESPSEALLMPAISIKYSPIRNLSFVSDIMIPINNAVLWEGCSKEERKTYFGLSAKL